MPSSRGGSVVWDQYAGKMITFGGGGPDAPFVDDTWTFDFDSTTWSWEGLAETVPSSRGDVGLDGSSGQVVMFGGVAYGTLSNETWVYDLATNTWTELETAGSPPSARKWQKSVYDGSLGKAIMFGGYDTGPLADTWAWSIE